MGFNVSTSGSNSIAMGDNTSATGENSIAMGRSSTSGGETSTAIGWVTTASGNYSTAIGNHVSTNNQNGSFIIGDNSTTTVLNSANINNFRARFAGGYKLFTSADLSTGCTLFAGDNAWTTGSSVYTKENFAAVNGEDFLQKISRFNLTSWNYKTQDTKIFRHYGPMAQDFYAAFGKDEYGTIGNDTTINSADFAGVSFIAIQALEKRTAEQQQYIQKLEKENSKQTEKLEAVQALLQQLQKGLEKVKAIQNKNL
ncbi:MAG: tail fiber domain-containing protein [Chitinophagaceae bacterium]|nr:tail fiber domain-containing protein [Chitinophagaceae bacterium]